MTLLILQLAMAVGPVLAAEKFEPLQINEGRFRAQVPTWQRSREKAEDRKQKKYGVTLAAPAEGERAGVSLALEYYAPGNPLFKDAGQYLVQLTAPTKGKAKVKGKLMGKPLPIRVRKEKGRHWFRESAQGEGDTKTETVLLGTESGFYVLTYTAPKKRFLKNRGTFQRVLDTFEPILE